MRRVILLREVGMTGPSPQTAGKAGRRMMMMTTMIRRRRSPVKVLIGGQGTRWMRILLSGGKLRSIRQRRPTNAATTAAAGTSTGGMIVVTTKERPTTTVGDLELHALAVTMTGRRMMCSSARSASKPSVAAKWEWLPT